MSYWQTTPTTPRLTGSRMDMFLVLMRVLCCAYLIALSENTLTKGTSAQAQTAGGCTARLTISAQRSSDNARGSRPHRSRMSKTRQNAPCERLPACLGKLVQAARESPVCSLLGGKNGQKVLPAHALNAHPLDPDIGAFSKKSSISFHPL